MKYFVRFSLFFIPAVLTVLNCSAGDGKGDYKTDPATGVRYLFLKQNNAGNKPSMGDVAFVRIVYKREDDSLLFDSHSGGHTDSTSIIPLTLQSTFKGSLEQGITMMTAGDSASFLINSDSLYIKSFKLKSVPKFIKGGSDLKFYVKLVRFESPVQLKNEQYARVEKYRNEMKKLQDAEADSIRKYLTKNNIKTKPMMLDSLYILERTGMPGKPVNDGDSIIIKYTGMFLNGTVFDQSDKGDGGAGTYKLLYRKNAQLIRGWLEVLESLHQGEKVRFLLPSSVAYGSYGTGRNIPPFTPLLFEIEMIKVISPLDK